jgi:hypothetical protein
VKGTFGSLKGSGSKKRFLLCRIERTVIIFAV